MKLAEALIIRGEIQKDLAWVKDQLVKSAKVQEGERPPEEPAELMDRAERKSEALRALLVRINEANLRSRDALGASLTELLALRDVLRIKHGIYADAYAESTSKEERYSRGEIRWERAVDSQVLRKRIEALSREIRDINIRIQKLNWEIDIEAIEGI